MENKNKKIRVEETNFSIFKGDVLCLLLQKLDIISLSKLSIAHKPTFEKVKDDKFCKNYLKKHKNEISELCLSWKSAACPGIYSKWRHHFEEADKYIIDRNYLIFYKKLFSKNSKYKYNPKNTEGHLKFFSAIFSAASPKLQEEVYRAYFVICCDSPYLGASLLRTNYFMKILADPDYGKNGKDKVGRCISKILENKDPKIDRWSKNVLPKCPNLYKLTELANMLDWKDKEQYPLSALPKEVINSMTDSLHKLDLESLTYYHLKIACIAGDKNLVEKILSKPDVPLYSSDMEEAVPEVSHLAFAIKEGLEDLFYQNPKFTSEVYISYFIAACVLARPDIVGKLLKDKRYNSELDHDCFFLYAIWGQNREVIKMLLDFEKCCNGQYHTENEDLFDLPFETLKMIVEHPNYHSHKFLLDEDYKDGYKNRYEGDGEYLESWEKYHKILPILLKRI